MWWHRLIEEPRSPAASSGEFSCCEFSKAFDDPGIFVELPLVNQIQPCVKAWREASFAGVNLYGTDFS